MKRVLFVIGWYNNETHKGIAQYAGEHGWHLNASMTLDGAIPCSWDGDGIITASPNAFPRIGELVHSTDAKIVYLNSRPDDGYQPSICLDHKGIAMVAADYLQSKGYRRYVCYCKKDSVPSQMRRFHFEHLIGERGGVVESVDTVDGWKERVDHVRATLKEKLFPIVVFATEDELVSDVTEACAMEGLRVPEDVGILGVNNDENLCLACGVPVSSIESNLQALGYEAAALLDRHMASPELPSAHHVVVHAPHVVTRRSTDILAVDHPGVSKALQFTSENYTQPIQIDDLLKVAAISRAGLFNAFRNTLDRTPGQEITRLRLEHAKRLLLESDDGMDSIAFDAGFQTAQNMYMVFRKQMGVSPTAFRKRGKTGG